MLRHHLLTFSRGSIFADVSFGPFEAAGDVPRDGTRFNFVTRAGVGATYRLKPDVYLTGGVHYWHLSNARIGGAGDLNPAINGVELYVGLSFVL